MHIVIEGTDAAGKNTQATMLVNRLREMGGFDVVHLSFPRYETLLGKAILRHLKRETTLVEVSLSKHLHLPASPDDPLAFQCMMLADKVDAASLISQASSRGAVVICDRWWQSSYSYGKADGLDEEWLMSTGLALPQADLNIFLDLSPEEALKRRPNLRDRYETDREKQQSVRKNYRKLWDSFFRLPDSGRWVTIDSSPSVDEVHEAIMFELYKTEFIAMTAEKSSGAI